MTGCQDSNATLPVVEIDDRLESFIPAVVSLLQRITSVKPTVTCEVGTDVKFSSELSFPDRIGEGEIAAELFVYRDTVRLDLHLEHNRVFATGNGSPSGRRCYLNDFVASVTLDAEQDTLPNDFVRGVVAGVTAARDAVRRHNRRAKLPWNEIRVAAGQFEPVG
jgi:hypothetical protein